jgi:hypothetical protein
MKKGRAGTMTHDYKRHGTNTLFAALKMLDAKVIGQCMARHRHQEVLRFLKLIDSSTSASWLNMVERFFAEITGQRIRRGVFKSVADLEKAIMDYLDNHNANPNPSSGPQRPRTFSKRSPVRNRRLSRYTTRRGARINGGRPLPKSDRSPPAGARSATDGWT